MNIAINGFGRIGRASLRAILTRKLGIKVVAINDLTDTKTLAHLFQYDTCYRKFEKKVSFTSDSLIIDGNKYRVYAEKDPTKLPWADLKVDVVLECTGRFTTKADCEMHLKAGAKKVIISAPAKGGDVKTFVMGVNEDKITKKDHIISNASCTTNCLAPVTEVVKKNFGIKKAIMSTIHSYTADQNLVDGPHKDLCRARAAAMNIVPTTTGAAIAVTQAIPSLKDKFDGISYRVPTLVVSLCDVVFITIKKVTEEQVNLAFKEASKSSKLKGLLTVTEEPLVSSDYIGNPSSTIVDLSYTKVIDGDLLKVVAWYDNEWGYSCRLVDMAEYLYKQKLL
jgi:glyceraldehyde 3-phosphate dehydrogenase